MFLDDLVRSIPQSGLAKVFAAYLASELSRFSPEGREQMNDEDEQTPENVARIPSEEILDDMIVRQAISMANI